MAEKFGIVFGAALACALLAGAAAQGHPFAVLLSVLAAMPIMIVTLGWGAPSGLLTAAISTFLVAALLGPLQGAAMAVGLTLPALAFGSLAQAPWPRFWVSAPVAASPPSPPSPQPASTPLGVLGLVAALIAFTLTLGSVLAFVVSKGGIEPARQAAMLELQGTVRSVVDGLGAVVETPKFNALVELVVDELPLASAFAACGTLLLNLYLAARAVAFSGRLRRPWTDVPTGFVLPRLLAPVYAVAVVAAIWLPKDVDQPAWITVGALTALYFLEGLAVLHTLTRGLPVRPFALLALYFALMVGPGWVIPALALFGLAESAFTLRIRAANAPPPKKT